MALLGNHVVNQGTISAQLGTAALGAGSAATLTFRGDSLVHLQVDRSVLNSQAANGGLIRADGGQVLMSAGAADALLASVVNNTGVIEARTVEDHAGTITLLGGMAAGTVTVAGTLDASAPAGGNGGFIETSAAHVEVANSARVTTAAAHGLYGSWLIDPQDFTVASTGGDITGAALSGALATTNETLQSSAGGTAGSGNVNINDPVSWGADTTLTLTASNNVNINSSITATGNHAGVVLNPNTANGSEAASGTGTLTFNNGAAINLTGTSPTVSVEGTSYIVINTLGGAADAATAPAAPSLQGMAATANLSKNYALGSNIDATATSGWNAGAGFTPIGSQYPNLYQGSFTGLGHTISNLFIDLPSSYAVGLFGVTGFRHIIQNVGLIADSVTGNYAVGGLIGVSDDSINNSYATGTVTGVSNVGGLAGQFGVINTSNLFVTLNNSYATGNVTGGNNVGGLVGSAQNAAIDLSYATGTVRSDVSGGGNVGGLVGSISGTYAAAAINSSYATGNVRVGTNGSNVGGLAGSSSSSYGTAAISHSYATGNVSVGDGGSNVGGLVGSSSAQYGSAAISNSYATGTVSVGNSGSNVGGLVGSILGGAYGSATVSNSYATGNVSIGNNGSQVGGLVGGSSGSQYGFAAISYSYATGNVGVGTDGSNVGGLLGANFGGNGGPNSVSSSYATGNVSVGTGGSNVGGLVGNSTAGYGSRVAIIYSYATGAVSVASGGTNVGGLVGTNWGYGSIIDSYANGVVSVASGGSSVGGLVGSNWGYGTYHPLGNGNITNSYATGSVSSGQNMSGGLNTGGLVGSNSGTINTSYAAGNVTGSSTGVGGLVGTNSGGGVAIISSYWNTTTSGQPTSAQSDGSYSGVGGLTTLQMQTASNFAGFTFSTTPGAGGNSWVMVDIDGGFNNAGGYVAGQHYDSVPGATFPMLTSEYSTVITNAHQLQLMVLAPSASYTLAANIDASATALGGASGGDVWSTPGGFFPVGTGGLGYFTGSFDGLGHTISNLTMAWPAQLAYIGLFGDVQPGSIIKNVGLINASVTAIGASPYSQPANGTGALVGTNQGSISNSYATGTVSGGSYVGGLVGNNYGAASNASISNSHATVTVSGSSRVGGLAGGNYGSGGSITNSYATGTVVGSSTAGGLVGWNNGSIANSYATGNVSDGMGAGIVGGLVGNNYGSIANSYATGTANGYINVGGLAGANSGSIANAYATGNVSGSNYVGGLVGVNMSSIANAYATGNVSGGGNVGGLVGYNHSGISNTYATGNVTGGVNVGGLVGTNLGDVSDSYAEGSVSGDYNLGGLVGTNYGSVNTSYAEGGVSGGFAFGGLVGNNYGSVNNSFWNSDIIGSGVGADGGGSGTFTGGGGLTGGEMHTMSNFADAGWSISNRGGGDVWQIYEGNTAPLLSSFLTPLTVTASNDSTVFNGVGFSGNGVTYSATPNGNLLGTLSYGAAQDAVGAGSYAITPTGLYSTQQGYSITVASATLTITPLTVTGSISAGSSVYGSPLNPGAVVFANLIAGYTAVSGATPTLNIAGNLSTSNHLNAGNYTGSESVGGTLSGADASDYTFAGATGDYTVTPLVLAGSIATGSSIYGSALTPGAVTFSNLVGSDAVVAAGTVSVNTTGTTSTSGHFTAGTHTGSESVGGTLSGADASDYTFAGATGDYTVTPLALSGAIATGSSVYGSALTPGAATLSGVIGIDVLGSATVTVNTTGLNSTSGNFTAGSHSGVEAVTALSGIDSANYSFASVRGSYTVTPLALTGSIAAGSSIYGAALTPGAVSLSNVISGDVVTAGTATVSPTNHTSSSGNFTAGTHPGSESVSGALSGADAGDYTFAGATGDYTVTPLALTGSIAAGTSVYGSTLAPGAVTFSNLVGSDAVVAAGTVSVNTTGTTSTSGHFTAGTHTGSESVGGTLSGADAIDYTFAGATGDYTVTPLVLSGAIATGSSVYGSALTPGAVTFSNLVGSDAVVAAGTVSVNTTGTTSTSGHFTAGTHTGSESVGGTLSGADASDYTFAGATGDYTVTPLALGGSIATGGSVYGSMLTPGAATFSGVIGNDLLGTATVAVNTTGLNSTSGNLTAGSHSGVEAVTALSGIDSANYSFASVRGSYTVTRLALTGSIAAGSSIYGAALTPGAVSLSNVISGDVVTAGTATVSPTNHTSSSGNFTAGTHPGSESVSGALSGADAGDYTFAGATGDYTVTPLALTGSIAAGTSVYGSTLAPGAVSFSNAIGGDVITPDSVAVSTAGNLSTSNHLNVGSYIGNESVGGPLTGADAANYTFAGATGNYSVAPLALSIGATGVNKVYDGTTSDAPTLAGGGVIPGDHVTLADAAANFASKNVGTAQAVTVSGISIGGADAADYLLNSTTAMATATISPASLTVTGVAASNKVYDGTTAAILAGGSLVGVMAGDAGLVALTEAGSFASKNAGSGIAVAAAETLTGAGAGNYVLVQPTGLTASITPATLTYDATPAIRTAGQSLTGFSGSLSGFVASETEANDTVGTLAWTTPATAASHAGQFAIDGGGLTASNYVFVEAPGNARALTLQAPAVLPTPTPAALPPAALSAIAELQAAALVPPASEPTEAESEVIDAPATLIAAQAADAGIQGSSGGTDVDHIGSTSDSQASAWGDYRVADTQRTIGTTGASLRILSGGVRLPP